MKIGITGHQRLDDPSSWSWVQSEIDRILVAAKPVIGFSSLAIGADQLFARTVLEQGGKLVVIVPFDGYEAVFETEAGRREYTRLLDAASEREVLEQTGSREDAYLLAGHRIVDRAEQLIAIWDGQPAGGLGGTADIVHYATKQGRHLIHLNPMNLTVRS